MTRVAALLVGLALVAAAISPAPSGAVTACFKEGSWHQTTEEVGSTTWTIDSNGKAQEDRLGRASGDATLENGVLTIVWKTPDDRYAGTYRWTLNAQCGGTGELNFTKTPPGDNRTGPYKSTVSGPPPREVFPETKARVKVSSPVKKVELQRNESGWEPAVSGVELANGDRVHTGFNASVVLTYPDGSRLLVGPMTVITLTDIDVGPQGGIRARVLLNTGAVTAQVNRSTGARGDFQVKTPTSTASTRGTTFSVTYDGTATTVAVTEGSVEVAANGGAKVLVTAGTETRSTATSVSPPVAIGKGFKSGGLSSAQALARVSSRLKAGLARCKFGVASSRLAPVAGGWSAKFVIVTARQSIEGKPKGTAQFRLKGSRLSAGNTLARRITKRCR
jgi:hypothetical protein